MNPRFTDRADAARQLATRLLEYKGKNALLLGIPRGGVPIAATIARELGGEVDVVLVRKLGAPGNPEFAVGAVDESGWTFLSAHAGSVGASEAYLQTQKTAQLDLIRSRRRQYTAHRERIDPAARVVIVVDDGLATGATMIAALHATRVSRPQRLVCAVPVAPPESIEAVRPYADEIVCLAAPHGFQSVNQFYRSFPQVEDEEVMRALA